MKKPSSHLFDLIKSLTKSEKRYFRQGTMTDDNPKKYLAVFDAIDKQTVYNEEKLKQKFKHEPWVNRFNSTKDYLYKALLNSLAVYNQKHQPEYLLIELITSVKVLQGKGLYSRSGKLIQKGKKMARELSDHQRLLELLNYESKNHPGGINPIKADEIYEEQQNVMALLKNEMKYDFIYKRSYQIFSRNGYESFGPQELKDYEKLMQHELLQNEDLALTFNAKRQFININYFNAVGNRDEESMHQWILKAVTLFQNNPKLIRQHAVSYATTLLNLESSFQKRKAFERSHETLELLRSFYPKKLLKEHERLTYIIHYAGLHQEIELLNAQKQFSATALKLNELDTLAKTHKHEISENIKIRHHYLMAITYFFVKDLKRSKQEINTILNETNASLRLDIHKKARILLVMVYYENGHIDSMAYKMRSIYRLFQRNDSITKLEKQIFKLFEHAFNGFREKDKIRREIADIKTLLKTNFYTPDHSEVLFWIESKL